MASIPQIKLNDGNYHSATRLWGMAGAQDQVTAAVGEAIKAGYRSIDTAQGYDNEEGVGKAIAESGREARRVVHHQQAAHRSRPRHALKAFEGTMGRLGIDQLDMFLIHWPVPAHDRYAETWKAFVQLQKEGRIKTIGVSNFLPEHIERIVEETGVTPAVNQIETHPEYQQRDMRDFHKQHGIHIESYSRSGAARRSTRPSRRSGRSTANGGADDHPLASAAGTDRDPQIDPCRSDQGNFEVFDFELDDDDMKKIAGLDKPDGKQGNEPAQMNDLF